MSLSDSILVGVFCMSVVFAVLGILWGIIRVFSLVIMKLENKQAKISSDTSNE